MEEQKSKVQAILDFVASVLKSPRKLLSLIGLLVAVTICAYFLFAFEGCECNGKKIDSTPIKIKSEQKLP